MPKDYFHKLSSKERKIIEHKGTEPPFSGEYNDHFIAGVFICRACKSPLYESNSKFNSNCGWPSFDDEINDAIIRNEDLSGGRVRTEICCAKCQGHLGHVFYGEGITEKNTRHCVNSLSLQFKPYKNLEEAFLGAGCFWQVEKILRNIEGVYLTSVGYMGGSSDNPSYQQVCNGDTNHAEVVRIYFNPELFSYADLLDFFWKSHNPTTLNRQGLDIGTQYRSIIFYSNNIQKDIAKQSLLDEQKKMDDNIVTQIIEATIFFRAEEYHQNYLNKKNLGSCSL